MEQAIFEIKRIIFYEDQRRTLSYIFLFFTDDIFHNVFLFSFTVKYTSLPLSLNDDKISKGLNLILIWIYSLYFLSIFHVFSRADFDEQIDRD